MSSTLRPSMDHGSIKSSCGLAFWPVGFSNAVILPRPTILKRVWVTLWNSITPTTLIRIGGLMPDNPWCGPPRLAKHVASAVRDGRGLVIGRNDLNGLSIPPGLTSAPQDYW